ncbi:MAG: Hsp20/alpha crystallin family protein [Acidobacteria bacterium]|nr:Hsp20/alpha crystallin family protein [Acidobacteriota bacterium]MCL5287738.1 Hsp20/alpha crystallin family protein [Acidobacteriota bacterium]
MISIVRRDPLRTLNSLQEHFSRIFDDPFFRIAGNDSALTAWSPAVDIYETEQELVMRADLPDLSEKDIDVRVENNMLTIRGERKIEKNISEDNYLRMERAYGSFSRSFSLPNTVNTDQVKADYRNGVLTVTLPKREESKPKQVKVSVSSNGK